MSRDLEKNFSENIDALLAGEEVQIGQGTDNDTRSAIDFARRLKAMRRSPQPAFAANLKARLMQQQQEKEAAASARPGWFARFVHQPVWQTASALLVLAIIGGVMWGTGVFREAAPTITRAPAVNSTSSPLRSLEGGAEISLTPPILLAPKTVTVVEPAAKTAPALIPVPAPTASVTPPLSAAAKPSVTFVADAFSDKPAYITGDSVNIQISLKNTGSTQVSLSDFPPVLNINQAENQQPIFSTGVGSLPFTVAPATSINFTVTWDQRDTFGKLVGPGTYTINVQFTSPDIILTLEHPSQFDIISESKP